MLIEQTIEKLHQMKLNAMATTLREHMGNADYQSLSFEDRLSLLVDRQFDEKESTALTRRLQVAKLKQPAAIEDIDFHAPRGLDKAACFPLWLWDVGTGAIRAWRAPCRRQTCSCSMTGGFTRSMRRPRGRSLRYSRIEVAVGPR